MSRRILLIILALAAVSAALPAYAFDLKKQVAEFSLPNGMKWLVVRRSQAPVFSGIIIVRTGGADEHKGKTGLAHMFEHMAFKGGPRLGTRDWSKEKPLLDRIEKIGDELTAIKGTNEKEKIAALSKELATLTHDTDKFQARNEVWEVLMRNGADDLNAYTSKDLTAYHASMPVSRLELWARVMAEIIFEPVFREFYTERSVVAEERRTTVENSPEGAFTDKLLITSFKDGPYSFSTIGFDDDVSGLSIADARAFHSRNYVPSNMVGVIVGDVTPAQVSSVMMRVFGSYASKTKPAGPKSGGTPAGNVREKMKFDAAPSVAIAFHKPTFPDRSEYVFDVITGLLCDGRSSRLEKRLIYEERIAQDVYCTDSFPGSRLDNLLLIWIEPLKGVSPGRIEREVEEELEKLRTIPAADDELERVRKQVTASFMYSLDSNEDLAESLARFQAIFGDWRLLADYSTEIAKVGAKDVTGIAQKYFVDGNRVIVERVK